MTVIKFKAAKAAIQRKRYAGSVLSAWDRLDREQKRQQREQRAEVERKARNTF
ncbi:hypothetical protein [Pseudacidovorax sp. NFM-22]|uniref:hypothetical protein n=1 Tax=Pseudacidovorax sp. NFM-22 TaxID=2744469 RepID=UPI001F3C8CE9|nr:hypothetical protein [Pseudacidovorax sp. NFM-22]